MLTFLSLGKHSMIRFNSELNFQVNLVYKMDSKAFKCRWKCRYVLLMQREIFSLHVTLSNFIPNAWFTWRDFKILANFQNFRNLTSGDKNIWVIRGLVVQHTKATHTTHEPISFTNVKISDGKSCKTSRAQTWVQSKQTWPTGTNQWQ